MISAQFYDNCPFCGAHVNACKCPRLATGEAIKKAEAPFEGLIVQLVPHVEGEECLAEGGCCGLFTEENLIDCTIDEVLAHPENYELMFWMSDFMYIQPVQNKEVDE